MIRRLQNAGSIRGGPVHHPKICLHLAGHHPLQPERGRSTEGVGVRLRTGAQGGPGLRRHSLPGHLRHQGPPRGSTPDAHQQGGGLEKRGHPPHGSQAGHPPAHPRGGGADHRKGHQKRLRPGRRQGGQDRRGNRRQGCGRRGHLHQHHGLSQPLRWRLRRGKAPRLLRVHPRGGAQIRRGGRLSHERPPALPGTPSPSTPTRSSPSAAASTAPSSTGCAAWATPAVCSSASCSPASRSA